MTTTADAGTASRLLTLLGLLQGRRDWPGPELAGRLAVSARTVRRDVDRLRALGYPIDALSGPGGGYALRAGAAMPPLLLDDEEAIAIAVGLRTAAGSAVAGIEETALRALVKLEQVLPAHLGRRVRALSASTSVLPALGGPTVDAGALSLLAAAARDHETVRFAYRGRDGAASRRTVEPHALVALNRRWYVVAFDPGRGGWRTFRVDRTEGLSAGGARFKERVLPGRDPLAFVQRGLRAVVHRYEARVVYHAPVDVVRDGAPREFAALEPLGPDACTIRLGDDELDWLALRIAITGVPFSVEGPPELRDRLAEFGAMFTGAAGEMGAPPLTRPC
jgi:predicted DNA-binding transcriptional regulator YafY